MTGPSSDALSGKSAVPASAGAGTWREAGADSRRVSRFLARAGRPGPEEILVGELGEPFREYRRRWELARSLAWIPPFPLHVDYELMSACNLRCPMCLFAGKARAEAGAAAAGIPESAAGAAGAEDAGISGEPSGGRSLPLCLAKDLLAEGAGSGQASMGFGGLWEPLLSRDIEELTERGRALGLTDAMLSTNGTLLSRSRARDLIGAGLTRLMVSLDAASEGVYSLMRPGASLAETEGNVMGFLAEREAAGKRLPLLRLSFCVTRLNEHELEPFLSRWEGKADFFSVQRYGDFGAGPPVFAANPPGPAPSGRCAQPFKRLAVRHDGTALPCCDLSGRPLALGNVRGSGLGGLWNGKAVASLREAILADDPEGLPEACRRCRAKYAPA